MGRQKKSPRSGRLGLVSGRSRGEYELQSDSGGATVGRSVGGKDGLRSLCAHLIDGGGWPESTQVTNLSGSTVFGTADRDVAGAGAKDLCRTTLGHLAGRV